MRYSRLRWSSTAFVVGLFTVLLSGCATTDGDYGYYGYLDADYYESYGGYYGPYYGPYYSGFYSYWGPAYRVGPYRDGGHRQGGHGGHSVPHTYRSAPESHSIPSIPSRSRPAPHRR